MGFGTAFRLSWIKVWVALLASLLIFPLAILIWLSVVKQWAYPQLWDSLFTLDNWKMLASGSQGLGASLWKSLALSSGISVVCTFASLLVSQAIEGSAWRRALRTIAYYPYLIAPVVLGTMLQYYFLQWGITGSWIGVGIAQLLFVFPYSTIVFSGFWTPRVLELHEQATNLGSSAYQTWTKITLPMASKWIVLCLFQCFLISWFEYGITQVIGVGRVPTLTIKVVQLVREANPHLAAIASVLMLLPPLLLLLINKRSLEARG